MTKIDPILGVKDVQASAKWYGSVFGWNNMHGGDEFAVLTSDTDEIMMCLHKWGEHDHPTIVKADTSVGNGLILYFRTKNLNEIRQNVETLNYPVEDEVRQNPNSHKLEFSLRDPDGYYLTIAEFHTFKG